MTMIFGHRGIPNRCLENSMEGFIYCIEYKADGIETDVHLTKDRIPVIMHDERIDRTTNGYGFIKDYTFRELRQYRLKNGEMIPSLNEVLKLVSKFNIKLNLELKTDRFQYKLIEKIILDYVNRYKLNGKIIYSSFNIQSLINLARLDNELDLNFLFSGKTIPKEYWIASKKIHISGIHPDHYISNFKLPQRIWTVNDEKKVFDLIEKNANGIITDDFVKVRNYAQ